MNFKILCLPALLFALVGGFSTITRGQEDLSRPDGLPSKIGGPSCNNSGGRPVATITGFLNVAGAPKTGTTAVFSVAVYAGGIFIGRRRLKPGGSFTFYCVPRENVMLVGEVDSVEASTVSAGMLSSSPSMNRQDVIINLSEFSERRQRTGVITVQNYYERKKTNQRLFEKALEAIQSGKTNSSIEILEQLLRSDAGDWPAWTVLGNVLFNNKRFPEAELSFEKSFMIKNDHLQTMLGLGRSALLNGRLERAIEILSAANVIEPNSADVHHYLGEAYFKIRKGSLGIPHMNRAIEIAPLEKAELHLRIAALYDAAKAKNLAANEYRLFLKKKPDFPDKQKLEAYIFENQ